MRTTLNISDALLAELKSQAARREVPFRAVVEKALHAGLAQLDREGRAEAEPFRVQPWGLGLKPAYHGVSLNQLDDQWEAERTAR